MSITKLNALCSASWAEPLPKTAKKEFSELGEKNSFVRAKKRFILASNEGSYTTCWAPSARIETFLGLAGRPSGRCTLTCFFERASAASGECLKGSRMDLRC